MKKTHTHRCKTFVNRGGNILFGVGAPLGLQSTLFSRAQGRKAKIGGARKKKTNKKKNKKQNKTNAAKMQHPTS